MTARPIIFSAPMIRALLAGEKTQTRRIAKVTDKGCKPGFVTPMAGFTPRRPADHVAYCPYGQPGDLLWVRETWGAWPHMMGGIQLDSLRYRADGEYQNERGTWCWRPSIHMPRWASRLTLRITDVRVQRLQEISEADAQAEGIERGDSFPGWYRGPLSGDSVGLKQAGTRFRIPTAFPRLAYRAIWESIHGPGSWDANPYVWALTFDVIHKNVDEVKA